jgi:hypothetical protein
MTEEDFQRIEAELSVTLPNFYKKTMADHPFPRGDAANFGLCNSPDEIIKENTISRKNGFFGAQWPSHLFIIGFDGLGNYSFVNLGESAGRVYFADHELRFNPDQLDQIAEKYESIAEYVEYLEGGATRTKKVVAILEIETPNLNVKRT